LVIEIIRPLSFKRVRLGFGGPMIKLCTLLICLLLSSCGLKKLVVKNLDTFLNYQISKHIPLNTQEKEQVKKDVGALLNDSKAEGANLLKIIKTLNIEDKQNIATKYEEIKGVYEVLSAKFIQLISKTLASLNQEQTINFLKIQNQELKKLELKVKKKDTTAISKGIKTIIGDLTETQEKILKEYEPFFLQKYSDRLQRRIKTIEDIKMILTKSLPSNEKEKALLNILSLNHRKSMDEEKYLEIILKFQPTLTEKQKSHFNQHKLDIEEMIDYFILTKY
jgi:hypothetical protein